MLQTVLDDLSPCRELVQPLSIAHHETSMLGTRQTNIYPPTVTQKSNRLFLVFLGVIGATLQSSPHGIENYNVFLPSLERVNRFYFTISRQIKAFQVFDLLTVWGQDTHILYFLIEKISR